MATRQRSKHIRFSESEKAEISAMMEQHYGEDMAEEVAYASFLMEAARTYTE